LFWSQGLFWSQNLFSKVQKEVLLVCWLEVLAKSQWLRPQRIQLRFRTESRTDSLARKKGLVFKKTRSKDEKTETTETTKRQKRQESRTREKSDTTFKTHF